MTQGKARQRKIPAAALAWVRSWDTGISSLTIFEVLSGREVFDLKHRDIPYDPGDFGRCYRLLQAAPRWRKRLAEVAAQHPRWAPFVEHWTEMEALYLEELPSKNCPKLYALMQRLREAVRGVARVDP